MVPVVWVDWVDVRVVGMCSGGRRRAAPTPCRRALVHPQHGADAAAAARGGGDSDHEAEKVHRRVTAEIIGGAVHSLGRSDNRPDTLIQCHLGLGCRV